MKKWLLDHFLETLMPVEIPHNQLIIKNKYNKDECKSIT